jgi:hypothetical protein
MIAIGRAVRNANDQTIPASPGRQRSSHVDGASPVPLVS